jgi:large subunit ribosomal protein L6
MRNKYNLEIEIPEGVNCEIVDKTMTCKKDGIELKKSISIPRTKIEIKEKKIIFNCIRANKKDISIIKTNASHIKNLLKGVEEKFVYELEICHVHFPMTVKVQGDEVVISNFLGEKINRVAKILEGVEVEIKGNKVTVSSRDIQKAGQTAANLEKSSKVPDKDRRIFQDGIFMTSKPGGAI